MGSRGGQKRERDGFCGGVIRVLVYVCQGDVWLRVRPRPRFGCLRVRMGVRLQCVREHVRLFADEKTDQCVLRHPFPSQVQRDTIS